MPQNLTPQGTTDALVQLLKTFLAANYEGPVDVREIAPGDFDETGQLILKKVAVRVVFGEATYGEVRDITRTTLSVTMPYAIACRHESLRSGKEMRSRSLALAMCVQTFLAGARVELEDGSRSEPVLLRGLAPARDQFGPVEDTYAVTVDISGYSQFPGTYAVPGSQAEVA